MLLKVVTQILNKMIYNSAGHHNLDSGAVAMYKGKLIKENENKIKLLETEVNLYKK